MHLINKYIIKIFLYFSQLKAWRDQKVYWVSQKAELEQRAEDGEEKADKLEKYVSRNRFLYL